MRIGRTRCTLLGGMLALALGGCGGSDEPCAAVAGNAPGSIEAPGDCAVSTVVAVDATGAIADRSLARDMSSAALRAAEHTVTAGGHLRMVVFAGDANAVEVIYDDDVPTLEQSDETRRGPDEQALRAALGSTLDSALGVSRDDPSLTRRVRELTRGGTSDIARAVRNALRMLQGESGHEGDDARLRRRAGFRPADAQEQPRGRRRRRQARRPARRAARPGERDRFTTGHGTGRLPDRVNQSAQRTDDLVEIWMAACEQTGAAAARRQRSCEAEHGEEHAMTPGDTHDEDTAGAARRRFCRSRRSASRRRSPRRPSARSSTARCPRPISPTARAREPGTRATTPTACAARSSPRASPSRPTTSSARAWGR